MAGIRVEIDKICEERIKVLSNICSKKIEKLEETEYQQLALSQMAAQQTYQPGLGAYGNLGSLGFGSALGNIFQGPTNRR